MYHYQKCEYRILEYTLSNLLKYSLLTIDIKNVQQRRRRSSEKNFFTDYHYHIDF